MFTRTFWSRRWRSLWRRRRAPARLDWTTPRILLYPERTDPHEQRGAHQTVPGHGVDRETEGDAAQGKVVQTEEKYVLKNRKAYLRVLLKARNNNLR